MMGKDLGISIEEKVHRIKAYLDETLTPEEEAEFRRWLSASVANRVLLDRIRDERILLNKIRFSLKNYIKTKAMTAVIALGLYLIYLLPSIRSGI